MGKIEVKKVVIDTNVVVSALLFGGLPGRLIPLWKTRKIRPYASTDMIDEYVRVLAYPKFQLSEQEIHYLLYDEVLPHFEIIRVAPGESIIRNDPSDDLFIWCARAAGSEIIVSGNTHLLRIKKVGNTAILTPAQFLKNPFSFRPIDPGSWRGQNPPWPAARKGRRNVPRTAAS
jgi:uncharacterized protein